jgi:hypothetical protein
MLISTIMPRLSVPVSFVCKILLRRLIRKRTITLDTSIALMLLSLQSTSISKRLDDMLAQGKETMSYCMALATRKRLFLVSLYSGRKLGGARPVAQGHTMPFFSIQKARQTLLS